MTQGNSGNVDPADPSALAWSLVAGAGWDVGFGLGALLAPAWLARVTSIDAPEPILRVTGVLLLIIASLYLVASRDPAGHRATVIVAIAGRILGAAVLLHAFAVTGTPIYGIAGVVDFGFAVLHWVVGRRVIQ